MTSRGQRLLHRLFTPLERVGIHVTPVHFYQPVPDTRRLPPSLWKEPSELPGIEWNADGQRALLDELSRGYRDEYKTLPIEATDDPLQYRLDNPQFSKIDAEALYCMIRRFKPRRIVEIGSGNSTLLAAQAIRASKAEDPQYECRFTAIEPYPNDVLRAGVPEVSELIVRAVQDVELDLFTELDRDDILFIDSSHVLKIGSDVHYEFLEVLPRLRPGVLVQVHDVFLPDEYPRHLIVDWHQFWNEQYLVQAFLAFNTSFEVLWSSAWLHREHPELLAEAFPSYERVGWPTGMAPSSLWLRRVR